LQLDGVLAGERSGRGPALTLIHGWALDRRMWAPQMRAFGRHFTTIRYDRRGFGASTCPANLAQELHDLDAMLEQQGLSSTALLGMSQGGRVALWYALSRPQKVTALVLQGAQFEPTPAPAGDPAHLPLHEYGALVAAGELGRVRTAIAQHPLMDVSEQQPRTRAAMLRMIAGFRGEDLRAIGAASSSPFPDLRERLHEIRVPTLVLTGDRETAWLQTAAERLTGGLPGARRAVVPGGGHMVNMSAPRAFNRIVIDFLRSALR
jgi:pimeloyl-ACP methyl ester carboxylesterase